jgi:hypothetical protein
MQITVAGARNFAQALEAAANEAESKGDASFDLTDTLLAQDDEELAELKDAVAGMPKG